jgi:phospholipase/lecithinase/hemolysin
MPLSRIFESGPSIRRLPHDPRQDGRSRCAVVLLALLVLPFVAFARDGYDHVVTFGDSLSDSGNVYALTGQQSLAPYGPIPTAPYAIGGHHFSNGATWTEHLAVTLRTPASSGPALQGNERFRNYAFGGATARAGGLVPDLSTQVGMYLADENGVADAAALFAIWIGGNDVRNALEALAVDPTGAASGAIIESAVTAISQNAWNLWLSGARQFLVLNSADLSMLPAVRAQGPQVQAAARQLSMSFNAGLAIALEQLRALPEIEIHELDVFNLLHQVVETPADFGLVNVIEPCLTFGVITGAVCDEPWRYLFWDAIHPTTATHAILADAAVALLLPEAAFAARPRFSKFTGYVRRRFDSSYCDFSSGRAPRFRNRGAAFSSSHSMTLSSVSSAI